ncbi:MAG: hypothetical protein KJ737_18800 [Proteobacteria bacterium]|nr:hypothetical protein [Pseudomonadota bacterium]
MKLIYFPFTYISESTQTAISSFFRRIAVFQSDETALPAFMRSLYASGFLEIITPVKGNETALQDLISSFKMWGNALDDKNRTYFKTRKGEVPFFTEVSSSKIKADLRQAMKSGKDMASQKPEEKMNQSDILLRARMILQLAQELDIESDEFQNGMQKYQEMEHLLFENIKCRLTEDNTELNRYRKDIDRDTSKENKLEERIMAWSLLLPYCKEETGIFITDKREVVNFLKEFSVLKDIAFHVGPIPAGHNDEDVFTKFYAVLEETLIQLARGNITNPEDIQIHQPVFGDNQETWMLEVYLVKGESAVRFFNKGLAIHTPVSENILNNKESMNTVICLIHRNN